MENTKLKAYRNPTRNFQLDVKRTKTLRLGFTLAELAIVILILAILLLVVFTVVSGITKISIENSPLREAKRQASNAMRILQTQINQAYYQNGQNDYSL